MGGKRKVDYYTKKVMSLRDDDALNIFTLINIGKANATTKKTIINEIGWTNMRFDYAERKLRNAIELMREEGIAICSTSSQAGYYIAKDEEELEDFLREYEGRAKRILKIANKIRKAFKKYTLQLRWVI